MRDTYTAINHRPESAFPVGARYYDDGIADYKADKTMKSYASRSYKDGWKDAQWEDTHD